MQNPRSSNRNVEAQYKNLLVVWAALIVSQFMFLLLIFFVRRDLFQLDFSQPILGESGARTGSTGALIIGFAVAAVTAVVLSFAFRRRLNERAVADQNPAQVQTGLIIALALCEVSSLFGLALAFAFEYRYFFLWIGLGILGMALHFPKREPLHAASCKQGSPPSHEGGEP